MKKTILSYIALVLFGQQLNAMEKEHPLIVYARNDKSDEVKKILQSESVSQKDKDCALEYATVHAGKSSGNYYNTIDTLLNAGADVNTASGRPLRWVASMGNEKLLERFLEVPGINLNARGAFGETSLTDAVKHGRAKIFAQLIAAGASFTQETKDHSLILAAREGHYDLVATLIGMGSDIYRGRYAGEVEGEACRLARYNKHDSIVSLFTYLYNLPDASRREPAVIVTASRARPFYTQLFKSIKIEDLKVDGAFSSMAFNLATHLPHEITPYPNCTMQSNVATKSIETSPDNNDISAKPVETDKTCAFPQYPGPFTVGEIGYDMPPYWLSAGTFGKGTNIAKPMDASSECDNDWSVLSSAHSEFSFEHVENEGGDLQ